MAVRFTRYFTRAGIITWAPRRSGKKQWIIVIAAILLAIAGAEYF